MAARPCARWTSARCWRSGSQPRRSSGSSRSCRDHVAEVDDPTAMSSEPIAIESGDDDDQLRWAAGMLLGVLFALLPFLTGRSNIGTPLVVASIGGFVVLPLWRAVGSSVGRALGAIAFVSFIAGMVAVGYVFDRAA